MRRIIPCLLLIPGLSGCMAGALIDVATAPVKAASKLVDLATTSQSEADETRGRNLRKLEERYGKLEREHREQALRCADGNSKACENRDTLAAELTRLRPQVPVEPD